MEKTSDYLTIRLSGLSKVEDQSPQSRLAALIFQDHLRRKRASRPLTGPYYWVPYPVKGQKKYAWKLIAFFDNDGFEHFLLHGETVWNKVRNLLRDWWNLSGFQVKALERKLILCLFNF